MSNKKINEKEVFLNALDFDSCGEADAYVQRVCQGDLRTLASVQNLLAAHRETDHLLDEAIVDSNGLLDAATAETPGAVATEEPHSDIGKQIDTYRVMELIGEGGFGLVYAATQEKPVKRTVALKVIKPGAASKEIHARFDAERQAVALMDHPNIAQIFDAGVTDDGRPYFVMELIRGLPVTDFCVQNELTLQDKVSLFIDICSAIHHAHQKGVIHRDLKPSNILVTLHDDKPVVKVIDFGVAKAIGEQLSDQTIYTRFYSLIGTPLYMSPEQAEMSGLDVDIRTDIYSLGVVLYQLLAGATPFDQERLNSVGYDEMRRIIRDEQPALPSSKFTTLRDVESTAGQSDRDRRWTRSVGRLVIRKTPGAVPADLDWVVMKAIEKDRKRRYESAAAMRDDLNRFLDRQPVIASPPSLAYRTRKLVSRHRVALLCSLSVAMALLVGLFASLYQASVAIDERNQKELALQDAIMARDSATKAKVRVESFASRLKEANVLIARAQILEDADRLIAADGSLSEAISLVPDYYLVWVHRARLRAKLFLWEEAASDFAMAQKLGAPVDQEGWRGAGATFCLAGQQANYQQIVAVRLKSLKDGGSLEWDSLQDCLISVESEDTSRMLAEHAEDLLEELGPRPRGPGPRGPGPRGPAPGSPPEIANMITAWAQMRVGSVGRTKALLHNARRGMGMERIPELILLIEAKNYFQDGDVDQARDSFERAEAAIDRAFDSIQFKSDDWFHIAFVLLLHKEVAVEVGGDPQKYASELKPIQTSTRESLFGR